MARLMTAAVALSVLTACLIGYLPVYFFEGAASRQPSQSAEDAVTVHQAQLVFSDDLCRFAWTIRDRSMTVRLTNLSNASVTVPVVGGHYTDDNGQLHDLFITTRLYRGGPRDPEPIPPHDSIDINVYPRDYLTIRSDAHTFVSANRGVFEGPASAKTPDEVIRLGSVHLGRVVQLSLPVRVGDRLYDYRFTFKLAKVGAYAYRDYL